MLALMALIVQRLSGARARDTAHTLDRGSTGPTLTFFNRLARFGLRLDLATGCLCADAGCTNRGAAHRFREG